MPGEKSLVERSLDLPEVPEENEELAPGIKGSDLDINAEEEQVCLKCKQCEVEQHMTLREYLDRKDQEGLLRCNICPDRPLLFFYKANLHRVKMAGFNHQREKMGISKEGMKARLGIIKGRGRDRRKRLPGK